MEAWFLSGLPTNNESESVDYAFYRGSVAVILVRIGAAASGLVPPRSIETQALWLLVVLHLSISTVGILLRPPANTWQRAALHHAYGESLLLYFIIQASLCSPAFSSSIAYASGTALGTYHIFGSSSYPEFIFLMFKMMAMWLGADMLQGSAKDLDWTTLGLVAVAVLLYFIILSVTYRMLGQMKSERVSQILEEKRKIETVIRAIPDGLLVVSDNRPLLVNESMRRMMSLSDRQPLLLEDLPFGERLLTAMKQPEMLACDLGLVEKDGKLFEWKGNWSTWDQKPALILICRDVTQLREFEMKAVRENNAKTTMLRSVSHDFRTPINCIINIAHDLSTKISSHLSQLSVIQSCSQVLLTLVNDTIDYTQMLSNMFTLQKSAFPARQLVCDIIGLLECFAQAKGLYLKLEYDPEVPEVVYTDSARVSQVLSRLVSSAIK